MAKYEIQRVTVRKPPKARWGGKGYEIMVGGEMMAHVNSKRVADNMAKSYRMIQRNNAKR
jgi:hypothetical protein